jgi:hypothetical protein
LIDRNAGPHIHNAASPVQTRERAMRTIVMLTRLARGAAEAGVSPAELLARRCGALLLGH